MQKAPPFGKDVICKSFSPKILEKSNFILAVVSSGKAPAMKLVLNIGVIKINWFPGWVWLIALVNDSIKFTPNILLGKEFETLFIFVVVVIVVSILFWKVLETIFVSELKLNPFRLFISSVLLKVLDLEELFFSFWFFFVLLNDPWVNILPVLSFFFCLDKLDAFWKGDDSSLITLFGDTYVFPLDISFFL